jgi:hypothetical protein
MHFIGKRKHFSYLTFQSSSTRQPTNGLSKLFARHLLAGVGPPAHLQIQWSSGRSLV